MVFVDRVSPTSLLYLLPAAMMKRVRERAAFRFHYFSASSTGRRLLGFLQRLGLMAGEEADFSWADIQDADGVHVGMQYEFRDTLPLCSAVRSAAFEANSLVARFATRFDRGRLLLYLEKSLDEQLRPTLMRIYVVSWYQRTLDGAGGHKAVYYLARTPWLRYLQEYSNERGLNLRGYMSPGLPVGVLRKRAWIMANRLTKFLVVAGLSRRSRPPVGGVSAEGPPFAVAIPYNGKGLAPDLSKNSDLFWVPFARLLPNQLLVYFWRADDPLDESKYTALRGMSIRATAVRNSAKAGTALPSWPRRTHIRRLIAGLRREWRFLVLPLVVAPFTTGIDRWIAFKFFNFVTRYLYWWWFFGSFNVKLHLDNDDVGSWRVASDQALSDLGGLSMSYQRSDESFASVFRASAVDVQFAFSPASAETERQSRSYIAQFVASGYVHDHAFALVKDRAKQVRKRLHDHGARFIICFLDEGSVDDKRWGAPHEFRGENYRYLLDKLLSDPTLGLIFKPKKPADLRRRLGPVSDLLDAGLGTGRCYIYDEGIASTEAFPCEASSASDVSIGILFGSTAATECALAGTPSLLIDRELVTHHPLYVLGEGRVVFQHWDHLWRVLRDYCHDPESVPGFGDWSPILDTLDQFRDGRAGERMGEYISWLSEGLAEGLNRDEALDLARARYTARWGHDKVVALRTDPVIADGATRAKGAPLHASAVRGGGEGLE